MSDHFVVPIRQLDQGTYEVRQPSGTVPAPLVGHVYVEGAGDLRVEHWALYGGFTSPAGPSRMDVAKAPSVQHASLGAFLLAMHNLEPAVGPMKYVRATCEYFTQLP